jgi:hypothetical protein
MKVCEVWYKKCVYVEWHDESNMIFVDSLISSIIGGSYSLLEVRWSTASIMHELWGASKKYYSMLVKNLVYCVCDVVYDYVVAGILYGRSNESWVCGLV